ARNRTAGKACGYERNIGGSGSAEGEGDAVKEESGGKGTQQKILKPGFGALSRALANGSQDIGSDGRNFEAYEDQQQFHRAGHEAHAHGAEQDQRVILGRPFLAAVKDVKGNQQGD